MKKDIPPRRPRFSMVVISAKHSIHIGMPNPKETPYKMDISARFIIVTLIKIGTKEEKDPKSNHNEMRTRRLNHLAIFVQLKAENATPLKLSAQTIILSKLVIFTLLTRFLKTLKTKKYQTKLFTTKKMVINVFLTEMLSKFKVMTPKVI
ncbi:MAG: hypothetical protein QXG39_10305 [Candidatus Aenigmatarchaeota archaeon]